jgi:hypothetical protein
LLSVRNLPIHDCRHERRRNCHSDRPIDRRLAQPRHHYERSEASLCLDCDTSFVDGVLPEAFAVVTPFAASGHALVSGICNACVARCGDDLMAATAQRWRIIWPDLRRIRDHFNIAQQRAVVTAAQSGSGV